MRVMAYCHWIGVQCDECGTRSVNERGLREVLGAGLWFRHRRSLNRHVCQACWQALPPTQRADYIRDLAAWDGFPASFRTTRPAVG
jgi:hypothetical protein